MYRVGVSLQGVGARGVQGSGCTGIRVYRDQGCVGDRGHDSTTAVSGRLSKAS